VTTGYTDLAGRGPVLDAVGHHPYARFVAGVGRDLRGVAVAGAAFWRCVGPFGPYGHLLGEPRAVPAAFAAAGDTGLFDGLIQVNLPAHEPVPAGWARREGWEYRWLTRRLVAPEGPAVRPVTDDDEICALLDVAYPDTELRPGHPLVRAWYGLHLDGQLVACAADRSGVAPERGAVPTGVIGAVAVHPAYRGRGLGAVVTAAVASALHERYELVGLGVTDGNDPATRIYEELGFTGRHAVVSARRGA